MGPEESGEGSGGMGLEGGGNIRRLVPCTPGYILCKLLTYFFPITSAWPHLRHDVGLEERKY